MVWDRRTGRPIHRAIVWQDRRTAETCRTLEGAMQFLADILGTEVDRPTIRETTALGAAWLAGSRAGVWPGEEGFAGLWKLERTFCPGMSEDERRLRYDRWRDAVDAVIGYAHGRVSPLPRL